MCLSFRFTLAMCTIVVSGIPCLAADGRLGVELVERNGKVVVLNIMKGSSAEAVGIEPGDTLQKVGTTRINNIQDALDAKAAANNNDDVPFIFGTPCGLWDINARFEKGTPYYKFVAAKPRPTKK